MIAAMMRRASTWITNVKQGGQPLAVAPDPKMERLAIAAAEAVGAAIAGVDVLVDATAAPTVLEVNSMPAWSGLQKVSKRNIAEAIASALMDMSWPAAPRNGALHDELRRSGGGAPILRRASPNSTRPNRATCIGLRPATAWRSTDFVRSAEASAAPIAAKGRAGRNPRPRRSRRDSFGGRSEHQSRHHPPVRAACGGRGGRMPLCARRWRECSIVSTGRTLPTSSPP